MILKSNRVAERTLPFVLNTIGYSEKQTPIDRKIGPGWHQFIWIKRGAGDFFVDGKKLTLKEGEGIFLHGDHPHAYRRNESDEFFTVWFTFFCDNTLIDYTLGDKKYLVFKVPDFLPFETEQLRLLAKGDATTLSLSAAGYSLVCELFEAITKQKGDSVIGAVKDYLTRNYACVVTLDEVAQAVGMDKYALCRYFRKNHKRSVMDELLKIRISKAKRMLRYTAESITVVSRTCGFEDPCYFAKRFSEVVGRSPSKYREEHM